MSELVNTLYKEFADREYAHAYLEENSNLRIAAQVRALRLQMGWSQVELAKRAAMSQERISKIEMADFDSLTLKTLRRLSEAFDVHLSVNFSSVADAIKDLMSLTQEGLVCETRELSLQRKPRPLRAPSVSATAPVGSFVRISQSPSSSLKILVRAEALNEY